MQNYTPPDGWGPVLHYLQENRLSLQAALTAFFIAISFSVWDGLAWRRAINAGFICFFVALAVSALLEQFGVSEIDWSFVVGVAVGGAGADRCRSLINAAVSLVANKKGIDDGK